MPFRNSPYSFAFNQTHKSNKQAQSLSKGNESSDDFIVKKRTFQQKFLIYAHRSKPDNKVHNSFPSLVSSWMPLVRMLAREVLETSLETILTR
jgi:hypothetical protein